MDKEIGNVEISNSEQISRAVFIKKCIKRTESGEIGSVQKTLDNFVGNGFGASNWGEVAMKVDTSVTATEEP
jgi:hypothetical protein